VLVLLLTQYSLVVDWKNRSRRKGVTQLDRHTYKGRSAPWRLLSQRAVCKVTSKYIYIFTGMTSKTAKQRSNKNAQFCTLPSPHYRAQQIKPPPFHPRPPPSGGLMPYVTVRHKSSVRDPPTKTQQTDRMAWGIKRVPQEPFDPRPGSCATRFYFRASFLQSYRSKTSDPQNRAKIPRTGSQPVPRGK